MERHNCCINTRAIIDYVRRHYGEPIELLDGLEEHLRGIIKPMEFLRDVHNWVSSDVCRIMYENARRMTGDDRVAFKIGFESVTHQNLGYIQHILLKAVISPKAAIKRAETINHKFSRNKRVEIIEHQNESAIFRLHWDPKLELNQDFCQMNQGVYSAIPTIWGLPPGEVVEACCQFEGADYCEFRLAWKNPSLLQRFKLILSNRRSLLAETLAEMERDKQLLEQKHVEVQGLNVNLQHKIDQLLSIQQASAAILAQLDPAKLMPAVLDLFVKTIGYSRALIMLVDEEGKYLRFEEGVGVPPDEKSPLVGYKVSLSRSQNLLARVANTGQAFICQDAAKLNLNPNNVIIRNYRPDSIVILPLTARGKIIGILAADRTASQAKLNPPDRDFLEVFANQVAMAIENARMYQNLRENYLRTMKSLASALEAKDPYTRGHSERVTLYSLRLAEGLDLPTTTIDRIKTGCILHDIGKIGVDRSVLHKKDPLHEGDLAVIRRHPILGFSIIEPLALHPDEVAIVRHHHERYDGKGYPDGLAGENIPLPVRVVTLCDAFDAMTSDRPYRLAQRVGEAVDRLKDASARQFDPQLVNLFCNMIQQGQFNDILLQNRALKKNLRWLNAV